MGMCGNRTAVFHISTAPAPVSHIIVNPTAAIPVFHILVGLSMMSYRLWERKEDSFGGLPVERPHGEVVILPLSDSQLFLKILKGIEGVAGIEFFIVLSMTALHFPVVSGSVGLNELMPDAELLQGGLKERFLFGSLRVQAVREF